MRILAALFLAVSALAQQPGESLPAWTPGTLDIHQINTGRGNAAFLIFPDGTTNMLDANRLVIGALLDRLKSAQGHIVVRVAPGGDSFRVLILDDSAETYKVKSIHGPYQSR